MHKITLNLRFILYLKHFESGHSSTNHILANQCFAYFKLIMRNQSTTKAIPKIYVTQINGSLESHSLAISYNH